MPSYKDERYNTWYTAFYYTDWQGKRIKKMKRGFATKKEAQEWERIFLQQKTQDLDMSFSAFYELYKNDMKSRLKLNTWLTKENIIEKKILPYFKDKKMREIKPTDVLAWQNEMINMRDKKGTSFSNTYKKTLHNQLSALFNHAVKFYELSSNPAAKVGNFGSEKTKDIDFWTQEEFEIFIDEMRDKPLYYYIFSVMYWTGIRTGELLAITPKDFDFEKGTLTINKSYQRLQGQDLITTPKTEKSNRVIKSPQFLCDELQEYISTLYKIKDDARLFPVTKSYLRREMTRGATETGVKRISLHSLRHSAISLLIDMGFSAIAIADRVGHESIDITYNYAHLFPSRQTEMADRLDNERGEF